MLSMLSSGDIIPFTCMGLRTELTSFGCCIEYRDLCFVGLLGDRNKQTLYQKSKPGVQALCETCYNRLDGQEVENVPLKKTFGCWGESLVSRVNRQTISR